MTTATGMITVGTTVETIGVEITGAESKPAGKPNAIGIGSADMIGNAIMTGRCATATKTITATIVANAR